MKRILLIASALGIASQVQATTPTELIEQMRTQHTVRNIPVRHRRQHVQQKKKSRLTHSQANRHASIGHHRRKMEKALSGKPALRRHFRTLKEFRRLQEHAPVRHAHRSTGTQHSSRAHAIRRPATRAARYLGNGWYVDEHGQYDEQYTTPVRHHTRRWHHRRHHRGQHAYRHYRRQWYLTYLYERASFYDRHGYFYGYFNQRGFMFEGVFYRYDRAYTYQDRLHGKDLFAHRFYRPIRRYVYDDFEPNVSGEWGSGGIYFSWSL